MPIDMATCRPADSYTLSKVLGSSLWHANRFNAEACMRLPKEGIASEVLASLSGIASGVPIPAVVSKNLFKAFNRLCTAAVDIPAAMLEGRAAEKRAESDARVRASKTSAESIAGQMKVDPEFARRASRKFAEKIIREQINLNEIGKVAAKAIQDDKTLRSDADNDQSAPGEISDEWLNGFEAEASQKTSGEMQMLFGRILAGEIRRPDTFSIKTLNHGEDRLERLHVPLQTPLLTFIFTLGKSRPGSRCSSSLIRWKCRGKRTW